MTFSPTTLITLQHLYVLNSLSKYHQHKIHLCVNSCISAVPLAFHLIMGKLSTRCQHCIINKYFHAYGNYVPEGKWFQYQFQHWLYNLDIAYRIIFMDETLWQSFTVTVIQNIQMFNMPFEQIAIVAPPVPKL